MERDVLERLVKLVLGTDLAKDQDVSQNTGGDGLGVLDSDCNGF